MTYKVHLDGYNLLPYLTGQEAGSHAKSSFISATRANCSACGTRTGSSSSREQRTPGTLAVLDGSVHAFRMGKMFNLRADPYERADITSNTYFDWYIDHLFPQYPVRGLRH